MGRPRKPAGSTKPSTKPKAVATKRASEKGAKYVTVISGIRMTLHAGTMKTPRDPVLLTRDSMQIVPETADLVSVDTPDQLVLKSGVVVNGARCEVDGDNCIVNGDHCTVNGDNCVVYGMHCIVRGKNATVQGAYCIVAREGIAKEVNGSHCTIRGIVLKQTGTDFQQEGGSIGLMMVHSGTTTLRVRGGMAIMSHQGARRTNAAIKVWTSFGDSGARPSTGEKE
jgi:hypothetical protein